MEYKFLFVNKHKLIFNYNTSSLNPDMNQHALNEKEKKLCFTIFTFR